MYQSSACHKIETMSGGGFWAPHASTVLCSDTSLVALSEGSFHSLSWRQNPIALFLLWMLLWNRRWFHARKCWKFLLGPLPFKWISTVDWRFRTIFWKGIVATSTCFICLWKRERLRYWNTLMSFLLFFQAANLLLLSIPPLACWFFVPPNWVNVKKICNITNSGLWFQVKRDKPATEDLNLKVWFLSLNILSLRSTCKVASLGKLFLT